MTSADNRQASRFAARDAGQKSVLLQWQHCDSDAAWDAATPRSGLHADLHNNHPTPQGAWFGWRWGRQAILGLVLLCLLTGVAWHQARLGVTQITKELQLAVDAEPWRLTHEHAPRADEGPNGGQAQLVRETEQLISLAAPGELVTMLEVVDLRQDRAVVQVELQASADVAYRQTRVYRHSPSGWTRTSPMPADWGAPQQAESEYLVLNYYGRDESAVAAALPRVDALYVAIYAALLPEVPGPTKVVVDVDPTWPAGQLAQLQPPAANLVVASPAATLLPLHLTSGDVLLQSIFFALFEHVAAEAVTRYALPDYWLPVRDGLRLWLLWQMDLPLAHWRMSVLRWVYLDPTIPTLPDNKYAPAFAGQLCAEHQIWMDTPVDLRIPVLCWTDPGVGQKIVSIRYPYGPPLKPILPQLPVSTRETRFLLPADPSFPESPVREVQLATILEYGAATYGLERIPALLAALPHHEIIQTLVPAVFGVSAADFEVGWQDFLVTHAGLPQ